MKKRNTIDALIESISNSDKLIKYIINNTFNKKKKVIILNLVYITFNFLSKDVLIEYYVEDDDYPSVKMSFYELIDLIKC